MIISRAPFRSISFSVAVPNYPVWFREHGGRDCWQRPSDKYCYISCRQLPRPSLSITAAACLRIASNWLNNNRRSGIPLVRRQC